MRPYRSTGVPPGLVLFGQQRVDQAQGGGGSAADRCYRIGANSRARADAGRRGVHGVAGRRLT